MEIQKLTAVSLGKKIKEKEISVREALDAVFAQIDQTEDRYHAYVTLDKEGAYKQADAVQEKIDKGELTGALAGVPVAIKDNMCTKGLLTTCSSKILYNFVPTYTAEAVLNLEKAGAVILGKTNMDEFAMGSTTETSAYGVTKNPWDLEKVPGGSSGGSAAAVAANECFMALGSDKKSVEHRACAGRFVGRFLCGGCSGRVQLCARFRHRRFDPSAEFLLWRDRHQADLRNGIPVRTDCLRFLPGSDRTDCQGCDRLRDDLRGDRIT